ncbi:MAG: TetR family transcriptional regulator [Clostridium sp.]|nr:TetR family transcriptional regulator [Clostridium sp.]
MGTRTRDKLIETAKQLFIRNGVENTTIGDIASASDKGRRTIYTYFRSKLDIYNAVIETESERMVGQLREISQSADSAAGKLRRFIELRLSADHSASPGSILKSLLSMDFARKSKTRKKAGEKGREMLEAILEQGVANGEFDAAKAEKLRAVLDFTLRAIDQMQSSDETWATPPGFAASFSELAAESLRP